MWNLSSSSAAESSGRGNNSASPYSYMAAAPNMVATPYGNGGVMPAVAPLHDRSNEVCKFFVNGGCVRGNACPYSHELPDERHLDVNGLGFILNPNVHNAQKTVPTSPASPQGLPSRVSPTVQGSPLAHAVNGPGNTSRPFAHGSKPPNKVQLSSPRHTTAVKPSPPPKYVPPEPYLEYNLPPVLALQVKGSRNERAAALVQTMLQN